jgi:hypothetical protein
MVTKRRARQRPHRKFKTVLRGPLGSRSARDCAGCSPWRTPAAAAATLTSSAAAAGVTTFAWQQEMYSAFCSSVSTGSCPQFTTCRSELHENSAVAVGASSTSSNARPCSSCSRHGCMLLCLQLCSATVRWKRAALPATASTRREEDRQQPLTSVSVPCRAVCLFRDAASDCRCIFLDPLSLSQTRREEHVTLKRWCSTANCEGQRC